MLTRRNWLLRLSIILNVVVLCYVGTHLVSYNTGMDILEDVQNPGRNLASIEYNTDSGAQNALLQQTQDGKSQPVQRHENDLTFVAEKTSGKDGSEFRLAPNKTVDLSQTGSENLPREDREVDSVVMSIPSKTYAPKPATNNLSTTQAPANVSNADAEPSSKSEERTLEEVIKCHDRDQIQRTAQRGDFWVLYNYVRSSRTFRCFESVTYTTHADYTFLDNLEPLLERWQGPVSVALHAPGTDFASTIESIQYLRECGSGLVAELVTFHVYFGSKHVPKEIPKPRQVLEMHANCSNPPPWANVTAGQLYKTQHKLLYPVNIGRNIARESAVTHYLMASDIELYPSPGVIGHFLELVRRQDPPLLHKNPKVFPLSIFELEADAPIPANKTQLIQMLKKGQAIPFHKQVCPGCHNVPRSKEWMETPETAGLHVFHIGKRMGYYIHWEPIYIGTNQEPLYDERLSWEGKRDKMTQGYALCVLDYEFQILDNAFLVHKPGIKTYKKDTARAIVESKTNSLIKKVILPELRVLYGIKKGCAV
ncbi:UNVERIFIED_CONTAM: hypothetical protein PYX00_004080 [Menopon gallinae]|uniref:N-acetyllactosaminide beta-1,3-N-acetylglucosaminyltransferase n=1 Tax=Menopon gallinae TaxID=328185 RepID=A0AAW2I3Y1_9NEOP